MTCESFKKTEYVFDFWHFKNGIFIKRQEIVRVTLFLPFLFLKMITTGLFPVNTTIIATATLAFYTLVKAVTSVLGFLGSMFSDFPLSGGFCFEQSQAFIPLLKLHS